ncbi:MAG: hypothetical protein C7B46_20615 [Sulfobacillus benefaciens]|uniref:Uncharacterized protein n=1 Tax=Sulfobacillus benefaciens TaxID=453960 RepID=A0A2T2WTH0_9FIRM|nr:MAG: hypothetical protein C7B46_20615 [Sulfobacillus benefaciens]
MEKIRQNDGRGIARFFRSWRKLPPAAWSPWRRRCWSLAVEAWLVAFVVLGLTTGWTAGFCTWLR